MNCGKCKLELGPDQGHTKCYGCSNVFHHACSVSLNTWKAKSQALKEEWRCEFCRKNGKPNTPAPLFGTPTQKVGESVSVTCESANDVTLESLKSSIKTFADDNKSYCKSVLSNIDTSIKNQLVKYTKHIDSHIEVLLQKIENLTRENVQLKSELSVVLEKVGSMELKMSNMLVSSSSATPTGVPSLPVHSNLNVSADLFQSRSVRNFAEVLAQGNNNAPQSHGSRGASPAVSRQAQPPRPPRVQSSASSSNVVPVTESPAGGSARNTGAGEWTTVPNKRKERPKSKNAPKIGAKPISQANPSSALMVKPKEPRVRALFVTRFAPL